MNKELEKKTKKKKKRLIGFEPTTFCLKVQQLEIQHLAPARYFHISYFQYLAVMSSKFIIILSHSANQINGYEFSAFL